jgi:hypothetical protein
MIAIVVVLTTLRSCRRTKTTGVVLRLVCHDPNQQENPTNALIGRSAAGGDSQILTEEGVRRPSLQSLALMPTMQNSEEMRQMAG